MTEHKYYPKTLVHPAAQKGEPRAIRNGTKPNGEPLFDYQGTPDRFPPVDVHNPDQESMYRAKGYLEYGEKGTTPMGYVEYPKMLTHPDYLPAIPDSRDARKLENGQIEEFTIKGRAEKFGPVTVKSAAEQTSWEEKGWREAVKSDPDAYSKAFASPYDPSHVHNEYPKMVDGVMIQDPSLGTGFIEYPKWVGDTVVQNATEERRERQRQGLEPLPVVAEAKPTVMAHDPALDILIERASKAGIDVQEGWGAEQILDALLNPVIPPEKPKNKGGRPRKDKSAPAPE